MGIIKNRVEFVLKHNPKIYTVVASVVNTCFKIAGLFIPIHSKRVLFTGHARKYNDSPKAIYEYMLKHKEFDSYELVWGLETPDKTSIPGRAKKIQTDTIKYFLYTLTCKYWIACVNIERGFNYKPKKIRYLNTWHGFPTKGTGLDKGRRADDFSYIDFFCVTGNFDKNYYQNCFSIPDAHFLKVGCPRTDDLYHLDGNEINIIKQRLGLPLNKQIILYAPTWRDSADGGKTYAIKPPIDLVKWKRKLGDKYIVLMRLHPYTNKLMSVDFDEFVLDYSSYPTVNDLLKITDILISDYSGIFFEFAILERPVICFGYDYDEYKLNSGFGLDLEKEIPGGVLRTEDAVIKRIKNIDYNMESLMTKRLKNKYLLYGGEATKQCVNKLFNLNL